MLTAIKENKKVRSTGKKQGSVGISNAFINNRVNEEQLVSH